MLLIKEEINIEKSKIGVSFDWTIIENKVMTQKIISKKFKRINFNKGKIIQEYYNC